MRGLNCTIKEEKALAGACFSGEVRLFDAYVYNRGHISLAVKTQGLSNRRLAVETQVSHDE